jgi:putative phage-type endonuclease
MEQRSDEWFEARLGKVTASKIADVMSTLKTGKEAVTRKNYRIQLVSERLTNKKADSFINDAMRIGIEREDDARTTYIFKHNDVEEIGFVDHPTIPMTGASPDGLVGDDGLIEIKCPLTTTHTDTLISGKAPSKYIPQMQWQMACTGRKWCDFVSFSPDFPENLQLFVVRVERDDTLIQELEDGVKKFLSEVDETVNKLKESQ